MPDRSHRADAVAQSSRRRLLAAGCGLVLGALAGCQQVLSGNDWEFPDGSPPAALRERTETFVARVEEGSFEAATGPFTDELAGELPPSELESTWARTVGTLGDYQGIGLWGYQEGDEFVRVYARVERESGHYALQLTFDTDRQIAGVFIRNVERNGN